MKTHDVAEWNGDSIAMIADYEWPEPHSTKYELFKCDPQSALCFYWVAADGKCYGLTGGNTCIALVETMVHSAGARQSYVTFALKNRASWGAWVKKWSKRTLAPASEFGTVKVTA